MRNKKDTWENQRERKTTIGDKLYGKDTQHLLMESVQKFCPIKNPKKSNQYYQTDKVKSNLYCYVRFLRSLTFTVKVTGIQ